MELVERKIRSLAESVLTHKALNNAFCQRWVEGSLPLADVEAATLECTTDQHVEEVSVSFNRFLIITEQYWNGIAHAMPREKNRDAARMTI